MSAPKRYIVTAALPYANGGIHLGHLAGAYLPADIYVRYRRQCGDQVLFVCGSDEHGVPITLGARKEGVPPQEFVDRYHKLMFDSFQRFGISFDVYGRTTSPHHYRTAQAFFLELFQKNVFIEETTHQFFDSVEQLFLADRYIQGTCPRCGYERAYGDQCEKCGSSLSPHELIHPVSVLSGKPPELRPTKHWYLPLQRYEGWLRQWILSENSQKWKPNVLGQCKSWLDAGLQPRAMTRDLDWGVPVPLPEAAGKVLYVWFDAPIGYISATQQLLPEQWQQFWQDDQSELIHFIGKDNIVFHCIIFPVLLKAHGQFILPSQVPAMEFLNLEGEKFSTSRNWAVWLHEYLDEFPDRTDDLRYVLISNLPETSDSDFRWSDFQSRINNELVAVLGNFVHRTMVLTHKYFDGRVPHAVQPTEIDSHYLEQVQTQLPAVALFLEQFRFRDALQAMMQVARLGNRYLAETEPWKQTDPDRRSTILNTALQMTAVLAVGSEPFLPLTASRIRTMLQLTSSPSMKNLQLPLLMPDHLLGPPRLLFQKIEDAQVQKQLEKLYQRSQKTMTTPSQPNASTPANKPTITHDQFDRIMLRVATILQAQRVNNSDKLLQLIVDLGSEQRTIVAGIAQYYEPQSLVGQQVCVVTNLEPKKIRGIESQGMLLVAQDDLGRLCLIQPAASVLPGACIS